MSDLSDVKAKMRHLEHIQKNGRLSPRARRNAIRQLGRLVIVNNEIAAGVNKREEDRQIRQKHEAIAKDVFDKLGRGKTTSGPSMV